MPRTLSQLTEEKMKEFETKCDPAVLAQELLAEARIGDPDLNFFRKFLTAAIREAWLAAQEADLEAVPEKKIEDYHHESNCGCVDPTSFMDCETSLFRYNAAREKLIEAQTESRK